MGAVPTTSRGGISVRGAWVDLTSPAPQQPDDEAVEAKAKMPNSRGDRRPWREVSGIVIIFRSVAAPSIRLWDKTPKALIWTVCALVAAGVVAYAILAPQNPLRVEVLDVSGYTDDVKVWMPFRLNLGLTNTGRDLITIRRVHVEPDFEGFNEAYNVGTYELDPPLVVEPGSSDLPGRRDAAQRHQLHPDARDGCACVSTKTTKVTYEFPAEFDQSANRTSGQSVLVGVDPYAITGVRPRYDPSPGSTPVQVDSRLRDASGQGCSSSHSGAIAA